MKNGLVRYARDEHGVARIELTNPPANAYSYEMLRDLDDAILEARFDEKAHVILLTGAGEPPPPGAPPRTRFFCAGADIAMLGRVTTRFKYMFCLHANETMLRLEHTPKLVIAAIEGHCVGGGMEIAMSADLRVAARGTGKMGLPEVALGVLPGTGGTQRLSRLVGKARAIELMTEGTLIDFDRAQTLGLVNHVWEKDGFVDRALEYARGFCPPNKASLAVGHIKRAVQTGAEMALEQGLALERELQQRLFESDDAREGIAAYNEKRKPTFAGE
ncbi:enoyl-CoA hydratase/isomerase family protein [Sandaracinus amylolyticus]|nr:enoyl-CoA hydratase-related protein [Sandaracinus amylolyticus]